MLNNYVGQKLQDTTGYTEEPDLQFIYEIVNENPCLLQLSQRGAHIYMLSTDVGLLEILSKVNCMHTLTMLS